MSAEDLRCDKQEVAHSVCPLKLWRNSLSSEGETCSRSLTAFTVVMLVSCLLSISLSRCLPLCCLSNTSTSSLICFFVQWELTPDSVTSLHALGCPKVSHWKVWPIDDHSLKTNYWFLFVLFCCFYIKLYLTKYQDERKSNGVSGRRWFWCETLR